MSYPMTDRAKAEEYDALAAAFRDEAKTWEDASLRAADRLRALGDDHVQAYFYKTKVPACVALSLAALEVASRYDRLAEDRRRAVTA